MALNALNRNNIYANKLVNGCTMANYAIGPMCRYYSKVILLTTDCKRRENVALATIIAKMNAYDIIYRIFVCVTQCS